MLPFGYNGTFMAKIGFTLADCTRALMNTRKFPDHNAHKVNEAIVELVMAYQGKFESTSCKTVAREDSRHKRGYEIAIGCLGDTAATAAVMKELIFTTVKLNDDGSYEAADLGMGTGILSLGAAIAGVRAGAASVIVHGVEHDGELCLKADEVLRSAGNDLEFSILKENILRSAAFDLIEAELENIRFWVSETINSGTPAFTIYPDNTISQPWYVGDVDPYPDVVRQLLRHVPQFKKRVRDAEVAFFPDLINGYYKPHEKGGTLQLRTSKSHAKHARLNRVGKDFYKICEKKGCRYGGMRWLG